MVPGKKILREHFADLSEYSSGITIVDIDTSVSFPPVETTTSGAASAVSSLNFFLFLHLTIVYIFMFM